ncbi:hypothetical protein AU510_04360 [Lonsdalea britannica]|uniref:hypothetical protein n=1 Tax=Lonsdalea britannica TaxID=1082704 RepID=UPI000A1E9C00|nr:hypothetical protein [Lonsdalea britannica]OSN08365.1 hypothetical protein AU510_04360 [Lonsdalea britannica]
MNHQLLRTYLIGDDRKYELYGNVDVGEKVTKVLEYSYRSLDPEENTAHWVLLGQVDISEFRDKEMEPYLYGMNTKSNDIFSIRQFCIERAKG